MQPPLKRLSTGTGQQEGQRMQDVDENFGRVEQAIDTLNANASLLVQSNSNTTATTLEDYFDDLLQNSPNSIPNNQISFRDVLISGTRWSMIIYRRDNALTIHAYCYNDARYYSRLGNGSWTIRKVTVTTV